MMCAPTILLFIVIGLSAAVPTLSYHKRNTAPGNAGAPAPALVATVQCTGKASSNDLEFYQRLTSAPSAVQRQSLLSNADFVFDFMNPCDTDGATTTGSGGHTVRADRASFPALVSQGASITIGFLGPCGFNTPHVHPRAAELNLVVEGKLFASVTAENGARHMNHTLEKWQMTVFPAGAMHTEFNPGCEPAVFVAAFPNEDPGVGQIAQEYFGLEDEIVSGSVGGELNVDGADIEKFRSLIPANVAAGVFSCLAKCGIAKR